MKDTFVDVKAELSDNTRVIKEMQVLNHEGFEKRYQLKWRLIACVKLASLIN